MSSCIATSPSAIFVAFLLSASAASRCLVLCSDDARTCVGTGTGPQRHWADGRGRSRALPADEEPRLRSAVGTRAARCVLQVAERAVVACCK